MPGKSQNWGSGDQGSSGQKLGKEKPHGSQESQRQQYRKGRRREQEDSELLHKEAKPKDWKDYSETSKQFTLQMGHTTSIMKHDPNYAHLWHGSHGTKVERQDSEALRACAADWSDGISPDEHLARRLKCSDDNARAVAECNENKIQTIDMNYPIGHRARTAYLDKDMSLTSSPQPSKPVTSQAEKQDLQERDNSDMLEEKGKSRATEYNPDRGSKPSRGRGRGSSQV